MTTRTMYDSTDATAPPASAQMVAGYVGGSWATYAGMVRNYPNAVHVSIAVNSSERAQVLDVETGDATPAEAVTWCTHTMADKPNRELTVYCNVSVWPQVRKAFQDAHVTEPHYWLASWGTGPDISQAWLDAGVVAKQYANAPGFDTSSVVPFWPGVDAELPVPVPPPVAPPPVVPPVVPVPPAEPVAVDAVFFRAAGHPEVFGIWPSGMLRHVLAAEWAAYGSPAARALSEDDYAQFKAACGM